MLSVSLPWNLWMVSDDVIKNGRHELNFLARLFLGLD
jgi:hypothetical protein